MVLGRYKLSKGKPLGTGGWCVVRRAEDVNTGKAVAVKTFGTQAINELGEDALAARFTNEVKTFEALGIGPAGTSPKGSSSSGARQLLVNLLDYSKSDTGEPGAADDGQYYTVLELANEALGAWMKASEGHNIGELCDVAKAVAGGLACLHEKGQCHLDVKPDNVMRFGDRWKLIDLEGCLPIKPGSCVKAENFTPEYASPELARFALGEIEAPEASGAMDTWALGVVLLDVIVRDSAFELTKQGCDMSDMFGEPTVEGEEWYRWLSSSEPIDLKSLVATTPGEEVLKNHEEFADVVKALLEKDPTKRPTAQAVLKLPIFAPAPATASEALSDPAQVKAPAATEEPKNERKIVEDVFSRWDKRTNSKGMVTRERLLHICSKLGLKQSQSLALIAACSGKDGKDQTASISWRRFLDFVFDGPLMPI